MTDRALLVGIDDYPGTQNDLNSCIQDTLALKRLLSTEHDFADSEIRILHNEDATLDNVRSGLRWLTDGAAVGDRRIYFHSSHGYRENKDGTLREVLCLYDQYLEDRELVDLTAQLPVGVLTVLIDACHSGGLDKVFFPPYLPAQVTRAKVFQPDAKGAEISAKAMNEVRSVKLFGRPPTAEKSALAKDFTLVGPGIADAKDISEGESELNGVLFAACRADETAAAGSPATNGLSAFTFALTAEFDPTIPVAELHDRIIRRLQNVGMHQTPVLAVRPGQSNLLRMPLMSDSATALVSTSIAPLATPPSRPGPQLADVLRLYENQGPNSLEQLIALSQVILATQGKGKKEMARTQMRPAGKFVVPELDWDRLISSYYEAQDGGSYATMQKGYMRSRPASKVMEKDFLDALGSIDWEQVITTGLQVYTAVAKSKGYEPAQKGIFDDIWDTIEDVDWDKVVPIAVAVGTTVA
jgi:hypothetical protein